MPDLIEGGLGEEDTPAVLLSSDEEPSALDERLPEMGRWSVGPELSVDLELPAGAAAYSTYSAVKNASKDDPDYAAVARYWKP